MKQHEKNLILGIFGIFGILFLLCLIWMTNSKKRGCGFDKDIKNIKKDTYKNMSIVDKDMPKKEEKKDNISNISNISEKLVYLMKGDKFVEQQQSPLTFSWCIYSPCFVRDQIISYLSIIKPLDKEAATHLDTARRNAITLYEYYWINGIYNPCDIFNLRTYMVEPLKKYVFDLSSSIFLLLSDVKRGMLTVQ